MTPTTHPKSKEEKLVEYNDWLRMGGDHLDFRIIYDKPARVIIYLAEPEDTAKNVSYKYWSINIPWSDSSQEQVEEAFGVGQSWQYSVDFVVWRYRIALKIQARRKAIISAYASRYPEFYEKLKLLRFRGCAVSEQFNELRKWANLIALKTV